MLISTNVHSFYSLVSRLFFSSFCYTFVNIHSSPYICIYIYVQNPFSFSAILLCTCHVGLLSNLFLLSSSPFLLLIFICITNVLMMLSPVATKLILFLHQIGFYRHLVMHLLHLMRPFAMLEVPPWYCRPYCSSHHEY